MKFRSYLSQLTVATIVPVSSAISGCRSENIFIDLAVVENTVLPLEFHISHYRRYDYFRFVWPSCYFRLSNVVEITFLNSPWSILTRLLLESNT